MARPLLADAPPPDAVALAARFWPGPLTIVLPAAPSVAPALRGPSGGIGLRCSSDPWAAALVKRFGAPVTSTSANRSGNEPARSGDEALHVMTTGCDMTTWPDESGLVGPPPPTCRVPPFPLPPSRSKADEPQARMYVLDGGERRSSEVSTVIEFSKGRATLLRVGAIRAESIASVISLPED
jgi:tRNA A37 threonylcarbamoyladenosine synthetase subunit TsaC/SUA5/YrdC